VGLATGLFIAAITLTVRFWMLTRPGSKFAPEFVGASG
jgi:hypothetical protein